MRRARRGASCLIISRLSNSTGTRWAHEADGSLGERWLGEEECIAGGSVVESRRFRFLLGRWTLHSESTNVIRVFYSSVRSMTALLYHVHLGGQNT